VSSLGSSSVETIDWDSSRLLHLHIALDPDPDPSDKKDESQKERENNGSLVFL
jgi:hypothetical protein